MRQICRRVGGRDSRLRAGGRALTCADPAASAARPEPRALCRAAPAASPPPRRRRAPRRQQPSAPTPWRVHAPRPLERVQPRRAEFGPTEVGRFPPRDALAVGYAAPMAPHARYPELQPPASQEPVMSTVWLRVSRGDCLTPAPPGQQGPPKLPVHRVSARYSAQEPPAVSNLHLRRPVGCFSGSGLPNEGSTMRGINLYTGSRYI